VLSALTASDGGLAALSGGGVISQAKRGLNDYPDWPRSQPLPPRPRGIIEWPARAADASVATLILDRNLRKTAGPIRACYERALRAAPSLTGELTLRLSVARDRSIAEVATPSSTVGEEMNACARALLRRWRYPEPLDAPFTVEVKLKLRPGPADAGPSAGE
jgi:hypothetical protein